MAWTILRPTQFASNAMMWAASIRDGVAVRAPYADTGLPTIHPADIASVAQVALTEPGHRGQTYALTGPEPVTARQQVEAVAAVLVHLPRLEGWGENPPVKNGTSLGGYGAIAMNAALTTSMTQLPEQLRKTLTWDRGKELSGHAQFAIDTGTKVFFADPHSPWQRPTNENTNWLLRQYFPKGTDLSRWSFTDLEAVAMAINNRPRKVLGWRTPAEVFEEQLRSLQQPGVATTG
ncbi:hypothetical protein M2283_010293 [Streptomyces pseudovenezuelae]|uniref:Integrase catalytic domain-containing protein n=1 Tax=Streptomyces pseudovenezuelae TaxID=67350 RepID=A0ABT6M4M4_9ACTN|nr:hypothetical protein [Streptomyces pseudovenezuelae]